MEVGSREMEEESRQSAVGRWEMEEESRQSAVGRWKREVGSREMGDGRRKMLINFGFPISKLVRPYGWMDFQFQTLNFQLQQPYSLKNDSTKFN